MRLLRSTLTSPLFLKATSLILGFLLWSTMSDLFPRRLWITVPICFYNTGLYTVRAPENIKIELTGKRALINHVDPTKLAVHIDVSSLKLGENHLKITHEHLLLPASIALATVIPHTVIVHLTKGGTV